jgi:glycosyltransferase involved in cell wall biosynthesis
MEVVTNVPGKPGGFWHGHTTLVGPTRPPRWLCRSLGNNWATRLTNIIAVLRLLRRRSPDRAFVTGGGLDGLLFAALQSLFASRRSRHVMVDCNWYRAGSSWRRWLQKKQIQWAARSVAKFVVWATHEVEDYARAFGVGEEKFLYVPFHTTLDFYQFDIRDDGYVFAGGNYDRDYPTLLEAVRSVDIPVWIATTRPEQLNGCAIPPHVRVEGTTAAGFRQAMAAAKLVVVPMQGGLLHSGGQQTCLNAMWLGKPTIAVGRRWAADLMEDGVHGLIVDYGDVAGLQRAIRWVLDHPMEAERMALRGQVQAQRFTTRRCMETIYRLARSAAEDASEALPASERKQQEVAWSGS